MSDNSLTEVRYSRGAVYARLLGYTKRYSWAFFIAVIGMCIAAFANGFFVQQVEPLVEKVFAQRDPDALFWVPFLIFSAVAGRALGTVISTYGMDYVAMSVIRDIRQDLFERYLVTPSIKHDTSASGEALSKVIYNVGLLSYSSAQAIATVIGEGLTAIYLVYLMLSISTPLVLVFFAVVPIMFIFVSIGNRAVRKYSERIQNSVGNVAQSVSEVITAHRVMKVFGGQPLERGRFAEINAYNRRQELKLAVVKSLVSPFVQFLVGLTLALIVYIAASGWISEPLTAGKFMAFFLAMAGLFAPLRSLTKVNLEIQRGVIAAQSVFEVLDADAEKDTGTRALEQAKGRIVFNNVSFQYNDDGQTALKNINLEIEAGTTVALVGQSGSGKSTLVSLLPRFYDVSNGEILLDGEPITEYPLADLRRQISYVGQDLKLFDDTLRYNIAYGELANLPEEQIISAATSAHAMEFIENMPQGLDSLAGESGGLLSGGQRQRIAIARAMLKNSPILILDEATSALDTQSERLIQSALDDLVKNRTTLVIAHRLSTIEKADKIVVMEQGKIVEHGTHQELLEKKGAYASLHRLQFGSAD